MLPAVSISFNVQATELPAFNAIVGASGTIDPVQLTGAGWIGEAWPKGLFAKIVDAASAATKLELTPELEADWRSASEWYWPRIRGKLIPEDIFSEVERLLKSNGESPPDTTVPAADVAATTLLVRLLMNFGETTMKP